jgi:uncharacterized OsmC-like protein
MNRYTLIALLGCLAVTSCNTVKKTTEPHPTVTLEVQVEEPTPIDPLSEITALLERQKIDISIQDKVMTPDGNLVLTLNGNAYFSDGATITINADRLDDLKKAVSQIERIMDISAQQSRKLKSLILQEESRVPVTYE